MADKKSAFGGLLIRLLSAVILIPPVVAIIWFGDIWFLGLMVFAGILMMLEWLKLTKTEGNEFKVIAVVAMVFVLLSTSQKPEWFFHSFFLSIMIGLALLSYFYSKFKMRDMAWTTLGIFYVLTPLLAMLWLRDQIPGDLGLWVEGSLLGDDVGRVVIFWVFLLVWGTDIGGYFAGKTLGGPKLAPQISPNKTWSGLIGGMILAGLLSQLVWGIFALTRVELFVASAGLAVFAQIGDLMESAIKRRFDVKDSGGIIPGHGGVLDRVDGLVPVTAIIAIALSWMIAS